MKSKLDKLSVIAKAMFIYELSYRVYREFLYWCSGTEIEVLGGALVTTLIWFIITYKVKETKI